MSENVSFDTELTYHILDTAAKLEAQKKINRTIKRFVIIKAASVLVVAGVAGYVYGSLKDKTED